MLQANLRSNFASGGLAELLSNLETVEVLPAKLTTGI